MASPNEDEENEGIVDKVKDFLNRPLWGTGDDQDEAKAAEDKAKGSEAAGSAARPPAGSPAPQAGQPPTPAGRAPGAAAPAQPAPAPAPVTPAPAPAPQPPAVAQPAPQSGLRAGATAYVRREGGMPLRLRSTPEIESDNIIGRLPIGTALALLDGPRPGDGYDWWQVRTPNGHTGWVAGTELVTQL